MLGMNDSFRTRTPPSATAAAKPTHTPIVSSRSTRRVRPNRQPLTVHRSTRIAGRRLYRPAYFIGAVLNYAHPFVQIPIDLRAD